MADAELDPHALTGLLLVIDDPLAPRVLAWWARADIDIDGLDAVDLDEIADLLAIPGADPSATLERTLDRCRLAKLLLDRKISPEATAWLHAHVGRALRLTKT